MGKKAIVVASFGTSYVDVIEKCIIPVETCIKDVLPGFDFYRVFTSRMIMRKLERVNGIHIENPTELFERLANDGYETILVQPTHILPGHEYHGLKDEVDAFAKKHENIQIQIGQTVLFENDDYEKAAQALLTQIPDYKENQGLLLMGHGSDHFSNSGYFALKHYLDSMGKAIYLANVEAPPFLEDMIKEMKNDQIEHVIMMPFMLVAGDHAHNDMAGDDEDSWKSILEKEGFTTEICMKGLGEIPAFVKLYGEKVSKLI